MGCKASKTLHVYDGTKDHALVPGHEASQFKQSLVQHHEAHRGEARVSDNYNIDWHEGSLGSGMQGVVRRCTHKISNMEFALKTIRLDSLSDTEVEDVMEEINIMKQLDHPNIVSLKETFCELNRLYIVMEKCDGGELLDRLLDVGSFSECEARSVAEQIASALKYLHDQNICHMDLKLENFLLTKNAENEEIDSLTLKLIDFGFSYKFLEGESRNVCCGTASYMAPETIDKRTPYTESCDMWSFGVIMFCLLSGVMPYPVTGKSDDDVMKLVLKHSKRITFGSGWEDVSDTAKDFVASLLIHNPMHRMSATDALKHAFLSTKECNTVKCQAFDSSNSDHSRSLRAPSLRTSQLQAFRKFGLLKRAAMSSIAFTLHETEVFKLRRAFQEFDLEKNGVISSEEFFKVINERGILKVSTLELSELFESLDQDHTGVIKYSEFLAASMDEKYFMDERKILDAFKRLDLDHTGSISKENFREFLGDVNDEVFERCFNKADIDQSGKLSLSEFQLLITT